MHYANRLFAFVLAALVVMAGSGSVSGQSISLTKAQSKRLAEIVHNNKDAVALYAGFKRAADRSLDDNPRPIEKIRTEGKLSTDPAKIETEAALADMRKLEALGYAYAVESDPKYAAKAREFVLAWAKQNHSLGDPIDDTNLEPLIWVYDLTRETFSPAERKTVDAYLQETATAELTTAKLKHNNSYNNWHSHRLKIVGLVALALQDKSLTDQVIALYKDQIDHNLEHDGSSRDFHDRDALHYHIYDIAPLLSLAIAARGNGVDLYGYQSPQGGTLSSAVDFLVPFATGAKTHAEFVNSKVSFDKKRADAGQKEYQSGSMFQPKSATTALGLAEFFDPKLLEVVQTLSGKKTQRYPTWQILLNDVKQ